MVQGRAGKKVLIAVALMAVVLLPSLSFSDVVKLSGSCDNFGRYYKMFLFVSPPQPYTAPFPTVTINTYSETREIGLVTSGGYYQVIGVCDENRGLRADVTGTLPIYAVMVSNAEPVTIETEPLLFGLGMFAGLIVVIFLKSMFG
jgi:hypothetical protein